MQKPWVNYHHLLYFKTIAQEGGIAKASKKLRLGQPTLSTQLKQFEDTIGHVLFDRTKKHLQLTDAGRQVLEYAIEIFKLGDEMLDALFDHHVADKIQVQFGATDTVPKHLSLKLIERARQHSDCIISMESGHNDELLRELRAHRLDLIITNTSPNLLESSGFFTKCIARMPIVICGSSKYSKLKKDFPNSLEHQPMIMPSSQTKLRHDLEHFLKLRNIHVNVVAEVQDTSLQKLMCSHDGGLIAVALPAAEELIQNKEMIMLGTIEDVHEELWLVAAQRKVQNPIASAILKDFKI